MDKVKELINIVVERKDIYLNMFIGEHGASISIYPLIDDEEV